MKNKKTRVLFIGPLPPPYSGPELSMHEFMTSEVLQNSFTISFLRTNFRKSNKSKGKFGILMILNFFLFFTKLVAKLIATRPKLVYYPITPTQFGWIGRDVWTILLSKLFGAKVIIHLRGSHFKLNFNEFSGYAKKLVGFSLKRVNAGIVQANYLKDQFAPFIAEENMYTLYQSINTDDFPQRSKDQVIKHKILTIGHLTKAKGYTDILKVIPTIADQFPEVEFCFAGEKRRGERGVFFNQVTGDKIKYEDPFEAEEKLLSSKYGKNYNHLGIVKGEEKCKQLQTTDIYLTASYSEGFSRAILEAMSTGIPLIYTPVGAHREVFNAANGSSFVPGNLQKLEEALLKMLADSQRQKIGNFNRSDAEKRFSVDKICNDFKKIINTVLT